MPLPADFEKRLWDAADQLWTNSSLLPSQYSTPVLALIFLKYADHRFATAEKELTSRRRRGALTALGVSLSRRTRGRDGSRSYDGRIGDIEPGGSDSRVRHLRYLEVR